MKDKEGLVFPWKKKGDCNIFVNMNNIPMSLIWSLPTLTYLPDLCGIWGLGPWIINNSVGPNFLC